MGFTNSLSGTMIPRQVKRMFDQRGESREPLDAHVATLHWRGRAHSVRLVNLSANGAMIAFAGDAHLEEAVTLDIGEQAGIAGRIRWVRDGRMGVHFAAPLG